MTKDEFEVMEVKAKHKDYYFVTLHQFNKEEPEHPDYFKDWLEFDGEKWDYGGYEKRCYVCFIHKRESAADPT